MLGPLMGLLWCQLMLKDAFFLSRSRNVTPGSNWLVFSWVFLSSIDLVRFTFRLTVEPDGLDLFKSHRNCEISDGFILLWWTLGWMNIRLDTIHFFFLLQFLNIVFFSDCTSVLTNQTNNDMLHVTRPPRWAVHCIASRLLRNNHFGLCTKMSSHEHESS